MPAPTPVKAIQAMEATMPGRLTWSAVDTSGNGYCGEETEPHLVMLPAMGTEVKATSAGCAPRSAAVTAGMSLSAAMATTSARRCLHRIRNFIFSQYQDSVLHFELWLLICASLASFTFDPGV